MKNNLPTKASSQQIKLWNHISDLDAGSINQTPHLAWSKFIKRSLIMSGLKNIRQTFLILLVPTLLSTQLIANETNGELEIESIADNVFIHTSYSYLPNIGYYPSNGLIVTHEKNAYLIDTAWKESDTPKIVEWIEANGFTLKAAIITHSHDDRASGLDYLNRNAVPTYALQLTNQYLENSNKPTASQTFGLEQSFAVDNILEVFYPGAGHTKDNVVVWIPSAKVMFGGCLIRSLNSRGLGNLSDAYPEEWGKSALAVKETYPDSLIVVPGHGKRGDRSLIDHTINLTIEIQP